MPEDDTVRVPHVWIEFPRISPTAKVCKVCGLVRQRNGSTDLKSCRGPVSVTFRAALQEARRALNESRSDA